MTEDPPAPDALIPGSSGSEDAALEEAAWFRGVFELGYTPMVAYARRRSPDRAAADDIVSEIFTTAWSRRHDFDRGAPPLPWLYGIANNVVRNSRRSAGRHLRLIDRLQAQPDASAGLPGTRPDSDADIEIVDALERLSVDDREVLRLAAWDGLSHAEIGTVLGCSTNAVGIRLHRARKRLAVELDDPHPRQDSDSKKRMR